MSLSSTLSDTSSQTTICILSPVRVKESTFLKLGQVQTRSFRIIHGDLPEHKEDHGFEETTYVAQLTLHLTHCDEVIRLPLLTLVEDIYPEFSYNLCIDLRSESELMTQIMPSFSLQSELDTIQCDINVYELIATACSEPLFHPLDTKDAAARSTLAPLATWSATSLLSLTSLHVNLNKATVTDEKEIDRAMAEEISYPATKPHTPFNPGQKLVRKLSNSMKKVTGRRQSAHKRTESNPQIVMDTLGLDQSSWEPSLSTSLDSTVSIDLS